MRTIHFAATIAIACTLASTSALASSNTCNWTLKGTTQVCTLSFSDANGAETRTMRVRIPANVPAHPALVVYLHGAPGGEYECDNSGWPAKCDAEGCVLACPRGGKVVTGGYSWNSDYPTTTPDDVAYLHEIFSAVLAGASADAKQVFLTGFSAGGWMTHRAGAELAHEIAAIGTISSSLYIRNSGDTLMLPVPTEAIPVIHMQGTADASIYYCGVTNTQATSASQDETFDYWAKANQCTSISGGPICSTTHGSSVPGGTITSITSKSASSCAQNVAVEFHQLLGGTHKYYGGDVATPPGNATTPYNPDLSSSTGTTGVDVLWNFFVEHPKGPAPVTMDAGADAAADAASEAGAQDASSASDAGPDASMQDLGSTNGCSCRTGATTSTSGAPAFFAMFALALLRRRRAQVV